MAVKHDDIVTRLKSVPVPGGGDLMSRDLVRALRVEGGSVRFVIEAESPEAARSLETARTEAEAAVTGMDGVESVSVVLTAHESLPPKAPPSLKVGRHPEPRQAAPNPVSGVDRIIAIGSGKGGRRKVDGRVQSCGCVGKRGPARRAPRCRHLWTVPAQDDGGHEETVLA